MNWMTVIFLFSVIVNNNMLLKCWASVIWEYDGGGRERNAETSVDPSSSRVYRENRRQKRTDEFRISFPSILNDDDNLEQKLRGAKDRDSSGDSLSRDVRTVVSPFFDSIPNKENTSPLTSPSKTTSRSNRRRARLRMSRRRRRPSRRPLSRSSRRRKKRKNRVNKRQTRHIARSLPGMDYLITCDYSDRYYCFNGGRCYYVTGIGVKICRCSSGYTGTRCSERNHGIAELMRWKIVNGTTRLANIRTPEWQARNQEDNDGFSSDTNQDDNKK